MKIHQLPLGARFEYEGAEYVKTGPLYGSGPQGQRLIPRYAVLKVGGSSAGQAGGGQGDGLARERVLAAFNDFYGQCRELTAKESWPELARARECFLKSLSI